MVTAVERLTGKQNVMQCKRRMRKPKFIVRNNYERGTEISR